MYIRIKNDSKLSPANLLQLKVSKGLKRFQKASEASRKKLQKALKRSRRGFRWIDPKIASFHKAFRSLHNAPNLDLTSHT